ncbi:DUF1648 domain-containing protein [Bacillus massilinigeriensis]|uniref:DUF1648 domain-containing protein n=1 Tax=Bacillus mediterraneensis TaxID=1805474 RepID=UPI0008F91FB3|nr:DUF1648 domain-containing protein [Bacillus mediterraneensis]
MEPKFKSPLVGKVLNAISLLAFSAALVYLLIKFPSLPDQVPTHYNAAGEPDKWGVRNRIFIPPSIGFLLWIVLGFLEKRPQWHNYSNLTEENRERLYRHSSLMLNVIKNEILMVFAFGMLNDIAVSTGKGSLLGGLGLPLILAIIFGTALFGSIRMFKLQKE